MEYVGHVSSYYMIFLAIAILAIGCCQIGKKNSKITNDTVHTVYRFRGNKCCLVL